MKETVREEKPMLTLVYFAILLVVSFVGSVGAEIYKGMKEEK